MRTTSAFVLVLLLGVPAGAAEVRYPVTIPSGCFELAQREGYPTVISSKWEATKARVKLARMRGSDPLVHQCRQAVSQAVAAYKANGSVSQ